MRGTDVQNAGVANVVNTQLRPVPWAELPQFRPDLQPTCASPPTPRPAAGALLSGGADGSPNL
eukprot:5899169-Pyramimonas_sp.AAC.1